MAGEEHPIFRKYQHLAAQDLLYLQAELCHLDWKYQSISKSDVAQEDERKHYGRDWLLLETSERRGFGGEQWAVAMEIRSKIREYRKSATPISVD